MPFDDPHKSEFRKFMERCALFICFPLLWWNEVLIRTDEAEFCSPALVTVPKWSWIPLIFLVNDPLDEDESTNGEVQRGLWTKRRHATL